MTTQNQKASVMAIVAEVTDGTLLAPTGASEFIPLRGGFSAEASFEELESDELLNDIGASEPALGKETPKGSHPAYLKHSEVEGQAPEIGLLIESAMGGKTVNATEYDLVGSSTVSVLNVDSGEGASFEEGQAILAKNSVGGYEIRNVESIATDALTMNFNLENAPALGVNLGKAILYKPAATGHPSFSAWYYHANGGAIQAYAGCKTAALSLTMQSGQYAEIEASWEGVESFFNPIEITAATSKLNFKDVTAGLELTATITVDIYKSPHALALEIQTKFNAAGTNGDTLTCVYSDTTGKFTFATDGTYLDLLWNTGTDTANAIGTKIGFLVAADDTGATSYVSDNEISYAAPFTASYDDSSNIVVKNAEIMIGDASENICRHASTVNFAIDTPTIEVEDICAESGVSERLVESRGVTMTTTLVLQKHEASLFDKFQGNTTTQVMVNVGPKDNSGNWVAGKCVNVFMQAVKITAHTLGGENFVTVELAAKGFVNSTKKDVFVNYI